MMLLKHYLREQKVKINLFIIIVLSFKFSYSQLTDISSNVYLVSYVDITIAKRYSLDIIMINDINEIELIHKTEDFLTLGGLNCNSLSDFELNKNFYKLDQYLFGKKTKNKTILLSDKYSNIKVHLYELPLKVSIKKLELCNGKILNYVVDVKKTNKNKELIIHENLISFLFNEYFELNRFNI